MGLAGALWFIAFGVILSAMHSWSIAPIIIGFMMATLPVSYIYVWDFLDRPTRVEIEDWGLTLCLRHRKKPDSVRWSEIMWLKAPPGDPATLNGRYDRDGHLSTQRHRRGYALYWPIAIAVREAYKTNTGVYPPTYKEYMNREKERNI